MSRLDRLDSAYGCQASSLPTASGRCVLRRRMSAAAAVRPPQIAGSPDLDTQALVEHEAPSAWERLTRWLPSHLSSSWARAVVLDWISRRSDVWIARTDEERDALYRLRHRIYGMEQGDAAGAPGRAQGRFVAPGDEDPGTILIGCGPRDNPTGTVRVQTWEPGQVPADYARDHALHRFPGIHAHRISHVGHLMVDRSLRGGLASLGFLIGSMELAARTVRAEVIFAHAAPGLLERYAQLGFRPYGAPPFGSSRGMEVPLALVPEPRWLRRSACLWAPVLLRLIREGVLTPASPALLASFDESGVVTDPAALRAAWCRAPGHDLWGLSPELLREVLQRSSVVRVEAGVPVMVQGFVETDLALVVDGATRMEVDGAIVAWQGAGALLGARASTDRSGRRSATVRTTEPTTLLVIREPPLRRLCRRSPTLRRELYGRLETIAHIRSPVVHPVPEVA